MSNRQNTPEEIKAALDTDAERLIAFTATGRLTNRNKQLLDLAVGGMVAMARSRMPTVIEQAHGRRHQGSRECARRLAKIAAGKIPSGQLK